MPPPDGVVIALNRLNRVLRVDPVDRLAVVEPGTINLDVSAAALPHGLFYAPDPSSQSICTIGGNVALNSGGAHCFKYGMTLNHVLAVTAVLADGTLASLGGASLETPGPDTLGAFVGSAGMFGIALEITLRLLPRPAAMRTVLAAFDSLGAAGDAVSRIIASGLLPGALEIMDQLAIEAAEAAVHAGYPRDAAAVLIVELEGEEQEVEDEMPVLLATLALAGATDVRVAQSVDERLAIWKGRKSAFSAVGRLSPDYIVQDGVVPRARLGEALTTIQALSATHGIRVANVFHAGDGNLHPLIIFDGAVAGEHERADALAADILRMCIAMGGSITGEHGVGLEKRGFLELMYGPEDVACMRRLQTAFDPAGVANPGKLFADQ